MIPTAEETARSIVHKLGMEPHEISDYDPSVMRDIIEIIKSQNKLHVEAALKAASKVELDDVSQFPEANDFEEGRELQILSAYPLTNIK